MNKVLTRFHEIRTYSFYSQNVDPVNSWQPPSTYEAAATAEEPHKASVGVENCDVSDLHGFEIGRAHV